MKSNSKKIGNNYERELSKKLSLWFSEGKSDDVCWRDSGSVNRSTIRKKQEKLSIRHGDIVAIDLKYKKFFDTYHVDSKSLGKVHLMLIYPASMKSSQLFLEWRKVCSDAEKFNKIPLMFVKARNDRKIPDFVIMPLNIQFLDCYNKIIYKIEYNSKNYSFQLLLQKEFFNLNCWENFVNENYNDRIWEVYS